MPKDVDPFKQSERLAKVTGVPPKPAVPPVAAGPPAAKSNRPPLQEGRVVATEETLMEEERRALIASGWDGQSALPQTHEGLKELQRMVADRTQSTWVPSAPTDTVAAIVAREQSRMAAEAESLDRERRGQGIPGLKEAMAVADRSAVIERQKVGLSDNESPFVMDTAPVPTAVPMPQAPLAAPKVSPQSPPATTVPASETGAAAKSSHCTHCGFDQSQPDVPEPPYGEKMAFLQCILGGKSYTQDVSLFGGEVLVTFRTLMTGELDVIYKQAFLDSKNGRLANELDYWEYVNRYRLLLQLQGFRNRSGSVFHDLADGYSKETNPHCTGVWVKPENEIKLSEGQTGLPFIEQYLIENVLPTEMVFRVVNNACRHFNRTVSQLEAMADNQDFWQPTGEQS
jgi:hypothetical protein